VTNEPGADCASKGEIMPGSVERQVFGGQPHFTIATLVNNSEEYRGMVASFEAGGFTASDCEFLAVDNTGPVQTSAYAGLNGMLDAARAPYVILCHQDVRLIRDGRPELEERLAELDARDPNWALAGNAGGVRPGTLAVRISDPHGRDRRIGQLPQRVASLDENFIVVKRRARIGFSRDLDGFHFYGADICLVADILGYTAYVIDFHLEHSSAGRKESSFWEARAHFRAKWGRALRARWIQTTCSLIGVSGSPAAHFAAGLGAEPLAAVTKRLAGSAGWTGGRD
jgi:hypothetical protein